MNDHITLVSNDMIKKVFNFGMKYYPELIPAHNGFCSLSAKDEAEAYEKLLDLYLANN